MLYYGYNVTKNRQNSRKAKSSKDSYALDITPAVPPRLKLTLPW